MTKIRNARHHHSRPIRRPTTHDLTRRTFLGTTAGALTAASLAKAAEPSRPEFAGYLNRLSVQAGDVLTLHISTTADRFDVAIDRVGAEREEVWSQTGVQGRKHAVPDDASARGCRWPVSVEIKIPAEWRSGYYEVRTSPDSWTIDAKGKPQPLLMYFVVRKHESREPAKMLLELATNTMNAYNNWGGRSLYAYNSVQNDQSRRVSFLRPAGGFITQRWETPFIQWAERNGYTLDYAVNNDLETVPGLLDRYRLMLSVGHDEYWSAPMRDAVESYAKKGGNVAFFSGNVCCWQVRREGEELVCYKEFFRDDPTYRADGPNPTLSTLWSHHLIGRPENTMTGVGVLGGGFHLSHGQYMDGSGAFSVHRPQHWVFAGTDVRQGSAFGGAQTVVGYECDGCEFETRDGLPFATGRDGTPSNFEILATAPAQWGPESTITFYDRWPKNQHGAACLGLYETSGGGTVLTAGTTDWSHGLKDAPDPVVERVTKNVLDRLST